MSKIFLKAFDKTYNIIGFKHSMFRVYDADSCCYPKSGLVGGFFQVEFASDADVSFLEKMVMIEWGKRNFEKLSDDDYVRMNCFSGKLSCHFYEMESGKVYEWKRAIVTSYEEIMHSFTGEPMKTRVIFSPFDLRVNNLFISRYSGKAEKGTWYFDEPEQEEQPIQKKQGLAVKSICCVTDLERGFRSSGLRGSQRGMIKGKMYIFEIEEYIGNPSEKDKENIVWEFSYKDDRTGIVIGTNQKKGGEQFTFDTNEHNIKSGNIWINAYFNHSKKEEEGYLDLPIYDCTGWFKNLKTGEIVWLRDCNDENETYRFLGKDNHSIVLDLFETDKKEESVSTTGTLYSETTETAHVKGHANTMMTAETYLRISFQTDVEIRGEMKYFKGVNVRALVWGNQINVVNADIRLGAKEVLHNSQPMQEHKILPNELVQAGNISSKAYKTYYTAKTLQNLYKKEKTKINFEYKGHYNDGKTLLKSWYPILNQFVPEYTKIKVSVSFENQ